MAEASTAREGRASRHMSCSPNLVAIVSVGQATTLIGWTKIEIIPGYLFGSHPTMTLIS